MEPIKVINDGYMASQRKIIFNSIGPLNSRHLNSRHLNSQYSKEETEFVQAVLILIEKFSINN